MMMTTTTMMMMMMMMMIVITIVLRMMIKMMKRFFGVCLGGLGVLWAPFGTVATNLIISIFLRMYQAKASFFSIKRFKTKNNAFNNSFFGRCLKRNGHFRIFGLFRDPFQHPIFWRMSQAKRPFST